MKMRFILTSILASLSLFSCAAAGIMDVISPKEELKVVTYTEITPEGALLRPVTPNAPAYYIPVNVGFHDFGAVIAGERAPREKEALNMIFDVLRKQGYLPCDEKHPPTLVLVIGWGTLNAALDTSNLNFGQSISSSIQDRLRFLGAYKLDSNIVSADPHKDVSLLLHPGLRSMDNETEALHTIASDSLFVAAISAYDFKAAKQPDKKKLWMTRIACPSKGFWMKEAFPSMIAIAGPNIGRETVKPVCVIASDKYKAEVTFGESKVMEYIENEKAPPADDKKKPAEASKPDAEKTPENPK